MPSAFSSNLSPMTKSLPYLDNQLAAFSITRYLLYVLLIFSPLARASVQGWAETTIHLITLIALTSFFIGKSVTWNWRWIHTPLDKPILILLILVILSTVFSLHRYSSIWSSVLLLNYLIIYYLIINTVRTRSQLRQLVYVIMGVAAFLSGFGLLKWSGINPFPWWTYSDIPQQSIRVTATFGNANHLAGYMEMALPLVLGFMMTGVSGGKRIVTIFTTIMVSAALILSLSRGGWLGALIGLGFMAVALRVDQHFNNKKLILALAGGFLVVSLITLSTTPVVDRMLTLSENDPEVNLYSRLVGWRGVSKMIHDYPLIGTGPGTFADVYTKYQPAGLAKRRFYAHNDYLHFISEVGPAVVIVILWIVIALFKKGFHKLKNPSRLVRATTIGSMSGAIAILVHSFYDFNLHIPANAMLLTVLCAIVAGFLPSDHD